jgi:hypothetical protein
LARAAGVWSIASQETDMGFGDFFGIKGSTPAAGMGAAGKAAGKAGPPERASHQQLLQNEISRLEGELKGAGWGAGSKDKRALLTDLKAEAGRIQQAMDGTLKLPAATQKAVDAFVAKLPAGAKEERAVVAAKAAELAADGYGVEQKGETKFAANLAMELSEYLAMGAQPSQAFSDALTGLVQQGMPVFKENPDLMKTYAANLQQGRSNALQR